MPDDSKEIGFIGVDEEGNPRKGIREPIKVTLSSFKNVKYLDIRKFYVNMEDNKYKPTTKGITVSGELFDELLEILNSKKDEINKWIKE
jgi:hypothetical protein